MKAEAGTGSTNGLYGCIVVANIVIFPDAGKAVSAKK